MSIRPSVLHYCLTCLTPGWLFSFFVQLKVFIYTGWTRLHQRFWVCALSWLWPVLLKLLSGRKVVLQESTGRWTVTGLLRTWTKFEPVEIDVANCVATKLHALTSHGTMLMEGPVIWREARSVKMEPSSKARQLVGLIANWASVIALVFEEKAFQHFFNVILTIYFILSIF